MKTIKTGAKNPLMLYQEISEYLCLQRQTDYSCQLPENIGCGKIFYNNIAESIQHIEINVNLFEDLSFVFTNSLITEKYLIIALLQGDPNAIVLNSSNLRGNIKTKVRPGRSVFWFFVGYYNPLPNFSFNAGKRSRGSFLFIEHEWLSRILKDNLYEKKTPPFIFENFDFLIAPDHKSLQISEFWKLLTSWQELKSNDKLFNLGYFFNKLGKLFYITDLLKRSNKKYHNHINLEDLEKITRLEAELQHLKASNIPALEDLAKNVGMSKTKMCRLFKMVFTEGIHTYHGNLRLDVAKELLVTTHLNISDIANKVSMRNKSYFSRWFKSATGLTPAVFRRENQLLLRSSIIT